MCICMFKLGSELGTSKQDIHIAQEQKVPVARCHQHFLKNQAYQASSQFSDSYPFLFSILQLPTLPSALNCFFHPAWGASELPDPEVEVYFCTSEFISSLYEPPREMKY